MKQLVTLAICLLMILFAAELSGAQKPELVVRTGHSGPVISVAFSPDGKTLASASSDNTVKLWAVSTGSELRTLKGHSDAVNSVAFSPDGKILASGSGNSIDSSDNTVKVWDVATGSELRTLKGHSNAVNSVAFSPNGKILASGGGDSVKLWEVSTGNELRKLRGHSERVSSVAFSPDGKILASGGGDWSKNFSELGQINLWDVSTGIELRTLNSSFVYSVAFSPDGKTLASGCADLSKKFSKLGQIKLWDVATGTELRTLKGHSTRVTSVAFSADGKILASGSGSFIGSSDNTLKLWDVATGAELRTLNGLTSKVAFSPDGEALAGGNGETVSLWDVSTGTELRTFEGHSNSMTMVAFSPNGKALAALRALFPGRRPVDSGSWAKTVSLWDVSMGAELRTLQGHSFQVTSVAFSPDGQTLASAGGDVRLWEVSTGTELRSLKAWLTTSVALSPDGQTLASGGYDKTVRLWDVSTGTELRTLNGHSSWVTSLAFSPDGKILASASWDRTVRLWEVSTGTELHTLKGHSRKVDSVAFSPDGKTLASGSEDTVKLWEVATGSSLAQIPAASSARAIPAEVEQSGARVSQIIARAEEHFRQGKRNLADRKREQARAEFDQAVDSILESGFDVRASQRLQSFYLELVERIHREEIPLPHAEWGTLNGLTSPVVFSRDGTTLASGSADHTIKLWDVSTGTELRTLKGHSDSVTAVAFSLNNKYLVSSSMDATIRVWAVDSGEELARLIALDEHWLVVTPDGLFDGPDATWNKIIWRFNNNTFDYAPVEAFFSDYYYPGLLSDIFAGKHPKAPSDIAQKDRRQPQLQLTPASPQADGLTGRKVTVRIAVSRAAAGAQDVRLFRNGSVVKVWRGDVLKGESSVTLEATIPILAGENRLTAYAFNHDNIKSSDATLVVNGAESLKRPGTAYILAVGLNRYSNGQYNLKYAVSDAEDFSAEVKRQQETLKNYARVEVISLYDKEATKRNILQTLSQLANKAQPEDAVLVYYAGHGTAYGNQFYLIPHDLGYDGARTKLDQASLATILAHSISDKELEAAFEKLDAGTILLVLDTCNSGQALESEEKRRGPMNSKGLAQLAYEKGMYILTASQSYQAAREAARLGHGFLTYVLVEEGLKTPAADAAPKDGQVLLREWLDYATQGVPRLQREAMQQTRDLEHPIAFVEGEEKIKDASKRSLQQPRVFYRREPETRPLIVAQPSSR